MPRYLILLICTYCLTQQIVAQSPPADTTYIKPFAKTNYVEAYTGLYSSHYKFRDNNTRESNYQLRLNSSAYLGGDVSYKWFYIEYSFNIPGTKLDNQASFKYRAVKLRLGNRKFIYQPFFGYYNGLLVPKQGRDSYDQFRGIKFLTAGMEVQYYFNPTRYSPKAANAFSEIQRRSVGSPIITATAMWDKVKWPNPSRGLIRDPQTYDLLASNPEWLSFIVKGGYAYNFVKKKWLIAPVGYLGAGMLRENTLGSPSYRAVTQVKGVLNAGYNGDNYYMYVCGVADNLSSRLLVKNVQHFSWNMFFTVGYRFKSPDKKRGKTV
ncbi:MAG: hypothetical protein DI535_11755 [Citrobacter freundii]|nr:MAG: hypothetical protein DI535_11755 [Citrobacter freundii]